MNSVKLGELMSEQLDIRSQFEILQLKDDRRFLAFQALAVEYMISAYKVMPIPIKLERSPNPWPHDLSDESWNELSRLTLRWLLLNGYMTSHEAEWASDPYKWDDHTQSRPYVGYDLLLTDKGLTAIGRVVDWRDSGAKEQLLEATREILGEGIKDAAKAKVGEMATDMVGRVAAAFADMFSNGQMPWGG